MCQCLLGNSNFLYFPLIVFLVWQVDGCNFSIKYRFEVIQSQDMNYTVIYYATVNLATISSIVSSPLSSSKLPYTQKFCGNLIFVGEHYPQKLDPRKIVPMNN